MVFNNVTYKDTGKGNPAQVNRRTSDLFINPAIWNDMPEPFRRFILLHEEGHLKGGKNGGPTSDEVEADLYAFRNYKNTEPNSLKNSVIILDSLLGHSREQIKRKLLIYSAALLEDWQHNKNEKALVEYHNIQGELKEYFNVTIPIANTEVSNWVGSAISAVMSLVGYGVSATQSNGNDAEEAQENAKGIILENEYELYKYQKSEKQSNEDLSITFKYGILIFIILSGFGLIIYKKHNK